MNSNSSETSASMLLRDAIRRVAVGPNRGRDISAMEAEQIMQAVLQQRVDDLETALFFIALRMKGESEAEYQGLFSALQASVDTELVKVDELYCLADPYNGYQRYLPVTPFLPAVLAACGSAALLTGVETVAPKHGLTAHKVFLRAGISVTLSSNQAARSIEQVGWAYLDQSRFADELFALVDLRHRMVKRTALTTLERLLMPLRAEQLTHLALGYVHRAYPEIYTRLAQQAGYASLLLVKGREGGLMPALNKPIRNIYSRFDGHDAAFSEESGPDMPAELIGDTSTLAASGNVAADAEQCLELGWAALGGEKNAMRNSLVASAAQIVSRSPQFNSFSAAVEKVQNCLDNGSAQTRFESLTKR
ncbi:MAG: anthranilate phosphoribosyltransferase [Pseudomonadota bacterium]